MLYDRVPIWGMDVYIRSVDMIIRILVPVSHSMSFSSVVILDLISEQGTPREIFS